MHSKTSIGRDANQDREWSDFVLTDSRRGKGLASHLMSRTAVYAIGPESGPPIKIGFSGRPVSRLTEVQIASPKELRFHLVCWLASKKDAVDLEQRCHRILKDSGRHIRGEWFNLAPIEAAKVIDRASIDVGCNIVPHKDLVRIFQSSKDPLAGYCWARALAETEL